MTITSHGGKLLEHECEHIGAAVANSATPNSNANRDRVRANIALMAPVSSHCFGSHAIIQMLKAAGQIDDDARREFVEHCTVGAEKAGVSAKLMRDLCASARGAPADRALSPFDGSEFVENAEPLRRGAHGD